MVDVRPALVEGAQPPQHIILELKQIHHYEARQYLKPRANSSISNLTSHSTSDTIKLTA